MALTLTRISAYLTKEQIDALKSIDERTMTEHVRNAVDLYLFTEAYSLKTSTVEYKITDSKVEYVTKQAE